MAPASDRLNGGKLGVNQTDRRTAGWDYDDRPWKNCPALPPIQSASQWGYSLNAPVSAAAGNHFRYAGYWRENRRRRHLPQERRNTSGKHLARGTARRDRTD